MFSAAQNTQRDSQIWVEKRRGVGREEIEATWWRKRRVQRGRGQSSQSSHSQVKMGAEDWVLKGIKFDNKYQKAKIKNLE